MVRTRRTAHGRGTPNAGPREHSRRPAGDGSRPYVLTGRLAWIERDGRLAVLRVDATNRRGRPFRGRSVTVDLSEARVSAPDRDGDGRRSPTDLLPGELVTVRVNLTKVREPPRLIVARLVTAHDHAF